MTAEFVNFAPKNLLDAHLILFLVTSSKGTR